MKPWLKALFALLLLLYPLMVYLGLGRFGVAPVAWLLAGLGLLRLVLGRGQRELWPLALVAILLGLASALSLSEAWLRYYPVAMNALSCALFAWSLRHPPTVIERLARLQQPELPASGVRWTRRVTQVWCGFFLLNGSAALYTAAWGSLALWTLYNGLIAYLLMGLLLGGEYLLRRRHLREQAPC